MTKNYAFFDEKGNEVFPENTEELIAKLEGKEMNESQTGAVLDAEIVGDFLPGDEPLFPYHWEDEMLDYLKDIDTELSSINKLNSNLELVVKELHQITLALQLIANR